MYGYIYLTTNIINNKQYIGQHKSKFFDEKYKGSGKILLQAFDKYGKDNFTCNILKECFSKEELDKSEKEFIEIYNCVESSNFYNLKEGGSGGSQKGLIYINKDDIYKRVKQEELNYYFSIGFKLGGYKPTKEETVKRAQSHVGLKYSHSENFLLNGSKARGKKLSKEHVEKVAAQKRGKSTNRKGKISIINDEEKVLYINESELPKYESLGFRRGFKKHSDKACENLKKGKSNTICIHKDNFIKYIKPKDLNSYLQENWELGRGKATRPNQKEEHRRWMTDGTVYKMIKECDIQEYLNKGFVFGKKDTKRKPSEFRETL